MLPVAIFSRSNTQRGQSNQRTNHSTVGWTGAFPTLSRKRPTASLVSRKVLTPLLGQVLLCIIIQLVGFEFVQRQTWLAIGRPEGNYSSLINTKVHSSTAGYPKVQHKEFGKHDSLPNIMFPIHILWDCTQCRPAVQTIHAKQP